MSSISGRIFAMTCPFGSKAFQQSFLPAPHLLLRFGQKLTNEALKCLNQREIRDIPFKLIEFTGAEIAALSRNGEM